MSTDRSADPQRSGGTRIAILLVGAITGLATPTEATVRPPVKIRMAADTKAATTGREYAGVFEIHVGAEGTLDLIQLLGEGWTLLALDAPAAGTRTGPGLIQVPFRAMPQDAEKPIGLSVTWNGRTVTKHVRVGEAAVARSGKPHPALRLETGVEPAAAPERGTGSERAGSGACGSGPHSLRVTGRIVYTRPDSQVVGVDAIWVQVMDENTGFDNCIWEGLTFADGTFDTGWVTTDDPDGPDVYVRWECDTGVVNVQDGYDINEEDYSWSTLEAGVVHEDFGGGKLDFGTLTSGNSATREAMHIHNTIVRAHRFILTETGIAVPEVDVQWPEDNTEYICDFDEIYVQQVDRWLEDVQTHEYGHHFECSFGNFDSSDYCNGVCDPPDDCTHCIWCDENLSDAWQEGFANWIADLVTRSFPGDYQVSNGCPYEPILRGDFNMETPQTCNCGGLGAACPYPSPLFTPAAITEGFIAALLRDIEDDAQDDHDGDGISDCMAVGPAPVLQALQLFAPDNVFQFVDAFAILNPGLIDKLKQTATNVDPAFDSGLPADAAPPAAVTNAWSPTHPIGGGPLPCITVMWDPADDDVSGAAAYDYVWNATPDPTLEPEFDERVFARCVASAAGPPIMPGENLYIRIRARDAVGNWGPSSAWFGPYFVNLTECAMHDNGIPDVCDIYCNLEDAPIACQTPIIYDYCAAFTSCGTAVDCNSNAIPDDCDIAEGTSADCGGDGTPDECQLHRYWIDGTGSWHAPNNWNLAPPPALDPCAAAPPPPASPGQPGPGEDVCINVVADATVTYSTGVSSINALSSQENLTVAGGTLAVASSTSSSVHGDLSVSGLGTFQVGSTAELDVYGTLRLSGNNATLGGTGTTRAWGGMTIASGLPIVTNGHHLDNFGVATAATGGLLLNNGSVFTNHLAALFDKQDGFYYAFYLGSGIFVNEGTFRKSGANAAEIAVALVNNGLVHVQFGDLVINPFFNAGSSNNGAFLGDAGTLIVFAGESHNFYSGSSIVADAVRFDNLNHTGPSEIQGTYNVVTSTTIRVNAPLTFTSGANVISYGSTLNVQGNANFNAVFGSPISVQALNVTSGQAAFNSGDPVNVVTANLGPGMIRGPSPVSVSGLLTWSQAGHFFDPGVINANGGLLAPAGSSVRSVYQKTINNAGPATILGPIECCNSSVFNNIATGVVDLQYDGTVFGLNAPPNALPAINNAGTWRKSVSIGTSDIQVNFTNTGTVEAQVGELRFWNATYTQTAGSTLLTGGSITAVTQGGTATGTLSLQGGELRGDGAVFAHVASSAATVAPGLFAGTLDVMGNYAQGPTGVLGIELGGPLQGMDYDWMNISGTASLAGTLRVELISGFAPAVGDQFVILTAGSVVGTFDTVEPLTPGLDVGVIYDATTVIVEITSVPGDCDDDGDADLDDYGQFDGCWSGPGIAYGPPGCGCIDLDSDLDIDLGDFAAFQAGFTG